MNNNQQTNAVWRRYNHRTFTHQVYDLLLLLPFLLLLLVLMVVAAAATAGGDRARLVSSGLYRCTKQERQCQ